MAAGLTDEQIEEFREAFHLFDRNHDGTITSKDLGDVLKTIGQNPSEEETRKLIEKFDSDGTGSIDFPEFLSLIAKEQKDNLENRDNLRDAFNVFDKEGDGFLNREQLENLIKNLGEEVSEKEAIEMIDSFRFDEDGRIDFDTFVEVLFNNAH